MLDAGLNECLAGVGHAGHARVGDINDGFARLQTAHNLLGALAFVLPIAGDERFLDADVVEQGERSPRVLAIDRVTVGQRLTHTRGEVA